MTEETKPKSIDDLLPIVDKIESAIQHGDYTVALFLMDQMPELRKDGLYAGLALSLESRKHPDQGYSPLTNVLLNYCIENSKYLQPKGV